jgi:hypothetical protein
MFEGINDRAGSGDFEEVGVYEQYAAAVGIVT